MSLQKTQSPIIISYCNEDKIIYDANSRNNPYLLIEQLEELRHLIDVTFESYNRIGLSTDDDVRILNESYRVDYFKEFYNKQSNEGDKHNTKNTTKGYVYLIHNKEKNILKIGFSKNPKARLKQLQIATSEELELLTYKDGTYDDEKSYHEKYVDKNIRGEWFEYSDEILKDFNL